MNNNKMVQGAWCKVLGAAVAMMGLTATAAEPEAVQLWKGGPCWATVNVGASEVSGHSEYGALYNFAGAAAEVAKLGGDWRLPTKAELEKLANASYCTKEWDSVNKGYTFTGATEGYKDKSIFLPAAGANFVDGREYAGEEGFYWSSEENGDDIAWNLYFYEGYASENSRYRDTGMSVRAVKDAPPSVKYLDWDDGEKKLVEKEVTDFVVYKGDTATLAAGTTYVVQGDITNAASRITVNGTVTDPTYLILCDGATLTAENGIEVKAEGATTNALIICAQSEDESTMGRLKATAGWFVSDYGAPSWRMLRSDPGIGVGGTVTINGGVVTAHGGLTGAGIGGRDGGAVGTVTINGGVVTANGGDASAGIGSACNGVGGGGTVTINGGTVTATGGGGGGAGIGGGENVAGGTVTINGGTVTATGGDGGVGIGGDTSCAGGTVTFGADYAYGVLADGLFKDQAAFSGDHSAKSVTMPVVSLKIPAAEEGYSYVVSNETAQLSAALADGTNTYGVVTGATAKVYFTLDEECKWTVSPAENPMVLAGLWADTVVPPDQMPSAVSKWAPGSEANPWKVGGTDGTTDLVKAWTNGTEMIVRGAGTINDLSAVAKGDLAAITITEATVTGAESDAFQGIDTIALTLPDNWQGELPKEGSWYGATGVTLTAWPLTVRNVRSRQRYPWNGLVDVTCDLTGAGAVTLGATVLADGVKLVKNPTLESVPVVDLDAAGGATNGVKFIWNAAKDVPAGFKAQGVTIKVTAVK